MFRSASIKSNSESALAVWAHLHVNVFIFVAMFDIDICRPIFPLGKIFMDTSDIHSLGYF